MDNDYSKTVSGVVKDILTHSETHTYGIKVRLQDGQIAVFKVLNNEKRFDYFSNKLKLKPGSFVKEPGFAFVGATTPL